MSESNKNTKHRKILTYYTLTHIIHNLNLFNIPNTEKNTYKNINITS